MPAAGDENKDVQLGLKVLKLIGYALVFIAGTLLNILLLIAVTRKKIRHNNTAKVFISLMQNLAVADLLLLVLSIPFDAAWHESNGFPYGEGMCKVLWPLQTACFQAVVFTYVILSFHRTYGVKKAYLFGQMKSVVGYLIIVAVWVASIATVIPYTVFLKHTSTSGPKAASCDEDWKDVKHRQSYTVVLFLLQYLIPLIVMIGFYLVTKHELSNSYRLNDELSLRVRRDRHHRVTRMLIVYLCVFAVLLLPHQIMWFLLDFGKGAAMEYFFDVLNVLYIFTFSITVTNPVLFFVYNQEFRSDMWYFLRCYCCRPGSAYTERDDVSLSFSLDDDPAQHSLAPYRDTELKPSSRGAGDHPGAEFNPNTAYAIHATMT